jgi:hypothetical protein
MSEHTGTTALVAALRDRRRNLGAAGFVLVVLAAAIIVDTSVGYYTASLLIFVAWMVWFVLFAIEWIKRAEF